MALALASAPAFAACGGGATAADTGNGALIQGKSATPTDFPATIYWKNRCTAAKVGPRHILTAAHCVYDPNVTDIAQACQPGQTLSITTSVHGSLDAGDGGDAAAFRDVVVEKTYVNPEWMKACADTDCAASGVTGRIDAADVALIVVKDETPDIPVAPIDRAPVQVGDPVFIVGYGCEDGARLGVTPSTFELKYEQTAAIGFEAAVHDGSFLKADDAPRIGPSYFFTPGPTLAKDAGAAAGLCPGDSGGPVYRKRGDSVFVVGVNSNYTFLPSDVDEVGLPVTNMHTRLSDDSRFQVADWLLDLGATEDM